MDHRENQSAVSPAEDRAQSIGVFNKFNFDLASLAAGEQRYCLNGIHVTNDFTEVTNGHYLMRISTPQINPDELPYGPNQEKPYTGPINAIVSADAAKQIQKNIPKNGNLPILNNAFPGPNTKEDGSSIEFVTTDLETWNPVSVRPVGAKYPNCDAVWPKKQPNLVMGFNPDYMMKLCQQFKKNKVKVVKLSIYGIHEAMMFEGKNEDTEQDIKALLMPCKVADEKDLEG
jgi:hypothetical protein